MTKSYVYDRVKQIISHLNILKRNIKQDIIEQNKERAKQHTIDIILLVQEADYQRYGNSQLDLVIEILEMQLDRIALAQEKKDLEEVIERISNIFSESKYENELSSYRRTNSFRRTVSDWESNLSLKDIIKNERVLNVLSFDAPTRLLQEKCLNDSGYSTYGICINEKSYPEDLIQNIAYGTGGNSKITNNAFDVVYVMPDSVSQYRPIGFREEIIPRVENATITTCLKYMRLEGLISIVMPYTRLDFELCGTLSKFFSNVQVTKVNDILVEINGIKKAEKVIDSQVFNTLRGLYKNFKKLSKLVETVYELPKDALVIQSFRGSRITDEMLSLAKAKSNAMSKIINISTEVDDLTNHKPLLPFNTGQIGLVLASGCLDGVVHEDDTHCHLIKGRVERKTTMTKGGDGSNDEITVYHSVQINALTPDGKLIEIS